MHPPDPNQSSPRRACLQSTTKLNPSRASMRNPSSLRASEMHVQSLTQPFPFARGSTQNSNPAFPVYPGSPRTRDTGQTTAAFCNNAQIKTEPHPNTSSLPQTFAPGSNSKPERQQPTAATHNTPQVVSSKDSRPTSRGVYLAASQYQDGYPRNQRSKQ